MKVLRYLLLLLCVCAGLFTALLLQQGGRVQTDLSALLPQDAQADAVLAAADRHNDRLLNKQLVLAIGAGQKEQAFAVAGQVAVQLRQSGLFERIDDKLNPDVGSLRAQIARLGGAVLPRGQLALLHDNPQAYFYERAEAVFNPFAAHLLPLEQDWLGFGRFVPDKSRNHAVQWDAASGMLYTEAQDKVWVWLLAELAEQPEQAASLPDTVEAVRKYAQTQQAELLGSGGALFAAHAKADAERESTLMSLAGVLLTFGLLLAMFRSVRIVAVLLPLGVGVLMGLAATLAVSGQIHALTLVIGTSLTGMLVDFPLHWLSPALYSSEEWQPQQAMKKMMPVFVVSLLITATGYVLLWFTPLPVLQQTAVFSVAALLGSFAATVCFLPVLFRGYRPTRAHIRQKTSRVAGKMMPVRAMCQRVSGGVLLLAALGALVWGVLRSVWHDDIRNWAVMPPDLLQQSRQIAELGGVDMGGRLVLVYAGSEDKLLETARKWTNTFQEQGIGAQHIHSLSDWLLTTQEQRGLQARLLDLQQQYDTWQVLREAGLPQDALQQAFADEAAKLPVSLSDSLSGVFADYWRTLYVGKHDGNYIAAIRLNGIDEQAWDKVAQLLADKPCDAQGCAQLSDRRQQLNQQFSATRYQAMVLKLVSFVLAGLLLWKLFGWRKGSLILGIPMAVAVLCVAVLGWLSVPVGLFAMFGLLLTTAIGVDYMVYVLNAPEPVRVRAGGVGLTAATTGISFGLLALSSTPAVAAFGLTVGLGCVLNWAAARILLARLHSKRVV